MEAIRFWLHFGLQGFPKTLEGHPLRAWDLPPFRVLGRLVETLE